MGLYAFDHAHLLSNFMLQSTKLSFVRVGLIAYIKSIYDYGRNNLECTKMFCYPQSAQHMLRFLKFDQDSMITLISLLIFYLLVFKLCLYFLIKRRVTSTI